MKSFSLLCLFILVLILALLSGDVSAAGVKGRMTAAKPRNLAQEKSQSDARRW